MKTLSFFSLSSLQNFANENPVERMDRTEQARFHIKPTALEVAGFSEVITAYDVEECDGKYYVQGAYNVLRIIPTGEVLRYREERGKYRFWLFDYFLGRDKGFTFDMAQPNLVGKATEKKLTAWLDYLHMERTARTDYSNRVRCANKSFTDKVLAKFPTARVGREYDGWVSYIGFDWERFRVVYSACYNGTFCREFSVNPLALPTDEQILG